MTLMAVPSRPAVPFMLTLQQHSALAFLLLGMTLRKASQTLSIENTIWPIATSGSTALLQGVEVERPLARDHESPFIS